MIVDVVDAVVAVEVNIPAIDAVVSVEINISIVDAIVSVDLKTSIVDVIVSAQIFHSRSSRTRTQVKNPAMAMAVITKDQEYEGRLGAIFEGQIYPEPSTTTPPSRILS